MQKRILSHDERLKIRTGGHSDLTNDAMDLMALSLDKQDEAYLGPFWYDPNKREVFGYTLTLASDASPYYSNVFKRYIKTSNSLHQQIWNKEFRRGKDKRFSGDYTLKPRGRVFEFENEGFKVFVGSWIEKYPEAKDEIIDVFQLPVEKTEFVIDEHWDIGHGWSQEF